MTICEMCGTDGDLVLVEVESVEMRTCTTCSKYGTRKRSAIFATQSRKVIQHSEPEFSLVSNTATILRNIRESKALSQEDFSKLINERESVVSKWEQGTLTPRLDTARKLERQLGIKLVQRDTKITVKVEKKKFEEFTLGDFIKVKKRH
jgi:putative transcription factor